MTLHRLSHMSTSSTPVSLFSGLPLVVDTEHSHVEAERHHIRSQLPPPLPLLIPALLQETPVKLRLLQQLLLVLHPLLAQQVPLLLHRPLVLLLTTLLEYTGMTDRTRHARTTRTPPDDAPGIHGHDGLYQTRTDNTYSWRRSWKTRAVLTGHGLGSMDGALGCLIYFER